MSADHRPYTPPEARREKELEPWPIGSMTALALCGGMGSRLESLTKGLIPKPLVKVNGKALIDYSIDPLHNAGVRRFLFSAAHMADSIESYIKTKPYGQEAMISIGPPTGIVPAIRSALNKFDVGGPTVIFDTDAVRGGLDFTDAYRFHMDRNANITLVSTRIDKPKNSNFVIVNEANNDTALILLNPEGARIKDPIIKCGMMICSPRATRLIRDAEDIPNSWIGLVEYLGTLGGTKTYITPQPLVYSNVNTPEELMEIEARLGDQ